MMPPRTSQRMLPKNFIFCTENHAKLLLFLEILSAGLIFPVRYLQGMKYDIYLQPLFHGGKSMFLMWDCEIMTGN